jgi:phage tail-like protein
MPKKSVTKIQYREGNDPDIYSLSAGLASMEDITLERGLVAADQGPNNESDMYKWMSAVQGVTTGVGSAKRAGISGGGQTAGQAKNGPNSALLYRKDVTILILDRTGRVSRKYTLYNAFPVAFNPGSDLNAGEDGEKVVESLTLAYEDFKEIQV